MRRLAAVAVASALFLAAFGVAPAEAATTYTLNAISVPVSGSTVTTTANLAARPTTRVDGLGITVKNAAGVVVGDSAYRANISVPSSGVTLSGSLSGLAVGSYTASVWVHKPSTGVNWRVVGAPKSFTIAATPTPSSSATPSASPTPSVSPSPTPSPSASPSPSPSVGPAGVPGSWSAVWGDEFDGSALTSRWVALDGYKTNNVTTRAANVAVSGGQLVLTRSNATTGAEVDSARYDGAAQGYELQVGDYVEARVLFPGNGSDLYNWPAWWTSGPNWPAAGEHDIAEVLGGDLTVNYHSSSGSHNQGAVAGYWGDAFHTYGVHRKATSADVYWDGRLVKSYATDDNGQGQALLINVGSGSGPDVYGAAGAVKVDWVRAWRS